MLAPHPDYTLSRKHKWLIRQPFVILRAEEVCLK